MFWLGGIGKLSANMQKRAHELLSDANDAAKKLKFQAAQLRQAESSGGGGISGSVVGNVSDSVINNIVNNYRYDTSEILERRRGAGVWWWVGPLVAIILGVIANFITPVLARLISSLLGR